MSENERPEYGTPEWDAYVTGYRQKLEEEHRKVWSTDEVQQEFEIVGFQSYLAYGIRKSDGKKVVLDFSHSPRFYWILREETGAYVPWR